MAAQILPVEQGTENNDIPELGTVAAHTLNQESQPGGQALRLLSLSSLPPRISEPGVLFLCAVEEMSAPQFTEVST